MMDAYREVAETIASQLREMVRPECHLPASCALATTCSLCPFNADYLVALMVDALDPGFNEPKTIINGLDNIEYGLNEAGRALDRLRDRMRDLTRK